MFSKNWIFLFVGSVFLLFVYNGSMYITDSVESNYALTAKEMVQSGNWISPQIYGNYWYDKPVMFYWVTAIAYQLFGYNEFAARFFPAVFGLLSLALVAWGGKRLYTVKAGFWSAVVLLTSFTFFLISKSIITDSLLFFFFSAALLCWLLGYEGKHRYYYGTYLFCALATLTKGPIGFLLPGLIIVVFLCLEKNWPALKSMKLFSGSLLFLAVAAPWYGVMYMLHGSAFFDVFFGTHNFLRATVSEHPRDNVIYYYTLVLLLGFFPWSGFLPALFKKCFRQRDKWIRPRGRELFLIVWAAVIFIFFQCMATKYITYTYPLIFPLAILMGKYIAEIKSSVKMTLPLVVQSVFYLLLIGGGIWANHQQMLQAIEMETLLIGLAVGVIIPGALIRCRNLQKIALVMAFTAFAVNLILLKSICVPLTQERSAKQMALRVQSEFSDKKVYVYGDYPASAVFYGDQQIRLIIDDSEEQNFRPKAYSWSSKNIMPYEKFSQIGADGAYVVVIKKRFNRGFMEKSEMLWQWQEEESGNWYIATVS